MRAARRTQVRWVAALGLAMVAGVPATAAGQTPVEFRVPAGTNTGGTALPSSFNVPLSGVGLVNPLGLAPGFYSINLGQCMGAAFGICTGSFLTHAASTTATGGLPVDPETALISAFADALGGTSTPTPTTMPGWTAFVMNFPQTQTVAVPPGPFDTGGIPSEPWTQQALSVAAPLSIEMPLVPLAVSTGPLSNITGGPELHFFERSESYDRLSVGWRNSPFMFPRPEHHVTSLSLRNATLDFGFGTSDAIVWDTFTADWANVGSNIFPETQWRIGVAAVAPDDLGFSFGTPPVLSQAATLSQMLARIQTPPPHRRTRRRAAVVAGRESPRDGGT